jgi:hypothetical protein
MFASSGFHVFQLKLQTALSSSNNKQLVALEVKLRVLAGEVEQLGEHAALAQKLQVRCRDLSCWSMHACSGGCPHLAQCGSEGRLVGGPVTCVVENTQPVKKLYCSTNLGGCAVPLAEWVQVDVMTRAVNSLATAQPCRWYKLLMTW